ncbi:hypothetical protein [Saprospira grandis]|uniref:hypothetical protein n=1 Tax=Saprospira grandis TaxID=1008 RepID=UPI0022DD8179|nr:hypothetical protein [Saprospira grandis]WBM74363.1 hypothetical protein OP864_15365 [Saprospira grandis]
MFAQTFVKGLHQAEKRAGPEEWCTELLHEISGWAIIFGFEEVEATEEVKQLELLKKEIRLPEEDELEKLPLFPASYQMLLSQKKDFLDEETLSAPSGCLSILGGLSFLSLLCLCIIFIFFIYRSFEGWAFLFISLVFIFPVYVLVKAFTQGGDPKRSRFLLGAVKFGGAALVLASFSFF